MSAIEVDARPDGETPASTAKQSGSEKLRVLTKVYYGFGAFGFSITNSMFMFWWSFFLTDVVLLAPIYVAVIQIARKGWDAINDPMCGMITDRTHTRWGRRRPFIFFAFIPFGVTFALLWQTPAFASTWAVVLWFILIIVVYDTVATLVWVPYNALTPELTQDYDERTSLNGYRQVFSMIGGLLVGAAVEPLVNGFVTKAAGYGSVGWAAGALAALPFLAVIFGVKERYQPTPKGKEGAPTEKRLGTIAMLEITLTNRAFLIALVIFLMSWVAVGIASTMFIYFLIHWMKMGVLSCLLAVQLAAMAVIPGLVWLSGKIGKRETYILGISFWAVAQLAMFLLYPGHAVYAVILSACAGIGVGAAHVLPWSMIPDCIEVDELKTGQRREGAYYGVWTFAEKAGVALALGGVNLVLQVYGYQGGLEEQPESARWAIRMLMGVGPTIPLLVSIVAAYFYPISRKRHAELRAELARRREERAAAAEG